jgi:hypothetical protein
MKTPLPMPKLSTRTTSAFLFDIEDTLLDNDHFAVDVGAYLERDVSAEWAYASHAMRVWNVPI